MKNQKGSLILSLVAVTAVAATIVATHQVTQVFSSGAGQKFNQQQAYALAQKSLAVAAVMVNKGIIACSHRSLMAGELRSENYSGRMGQPEGCRATPIEAWPSGSEYDGIRKLYTRDGFNLQDSYFNELYLTKFVDGEIRKNTDPNRGARYVVFKPPSKNDSHQIFKTSEITWSVRDVGDPAIRSALSSLSKGYICWEKNTLKVIEDGVCPELDSKKSVESILLGETECEDPKDSNRTGICDYYSVSDQSQGVVFLQVKVPYGSEDEGNAISMSAVLRRPTAIVKLFPTENSSCLGVCETAKRPNVEDNYLGKVDEYPQCAGMSQAFSRERFRRENGFVARDSRYQEGTAISESKIKMKNFGPGILYELSLKREDIDNYTNNVLSHQLIKNYGEWWFQRTTANNTQNWAGLLPGREMNLRDWTPCYRSHYYNESIQRVSCSYRMNRFNASHFDGAVPETCADGAVCDSAQHDEFAKLCGAGPNVAPIFTGTGNVLYGSLARESFTPAPPAASAKLEFSGLTNSVRSALISSNGSDCVARTGKNNTYLNNLCERAVSPVSESASDSLKFGRSAMQFIEARPGIPDKLIPKQK